MPRWCDEIVAARDVGRLRCGTTAGGSLEAVAAAFGLATAATTYREIDQPTARAILADVLHRDLAYSVAVMTAERADAFAEVFLTATAQPDARYYTNVGESWRAPSGTSWTPATTATFDRGVLVVSPTGSACLWVEDED